ncbi:flagellar motor protein MotB [Lentibacter sp. XHP0401]|uniref:flagellar motor protein MotB n=1 Tax=Lentibacter sp. XHP0401 TaxID=2984334 RepID=UPI0021E90BB2|nr:flagellar motor protein MotB [Lentibacter sp. XHP0401]MCV2892431.1 chemotaxis protein MotB [Lentibacter sp. XHP0401]
MSTHSNVAPIIIKRKKKVVGGGHHGGAWKVAYADFVTAMMAFFLLMWLLNATTEQQRKGVADYFSPTIPINRVSGGGDGNFGGDSVFSEEVLPQTGTGASRQFPTASQQARGEMGVAEDSEKTADTEAAFRKIEEALMGLGGESMISDGTMKHIVTRVTDEGMIIEIFDAGERALFEVGTDVPTFVLRDLADVIARVTLLTENNIAIGAHTKAEPVVLADNPVWSLSSERANQMRIMLEERGIKRDRIKRQTGHADKSPAVENRMAARNNRLEIVLLRTDR